MVTSSSAFELRPIVDDELLAWMKLVNRSFHNLQRPSEEGVELRRKRSIGQRVNATFDGAQIVGTFRSYDISLPVPGGAVAANAVSGVTVAPTHRRRGILTTMMDADLAAAKERGDVLAVLIPSEAPIYGRFGYGLATEHCRWTLDRAAARFLIDPARSGEVTLQQVEDPDLADFAPALYATAAAGMPGAMPRDDIWWQVAMGIVGATGEDATRVRTAVLARDRSGQAVGSASYRVTDSWDGRRATSTVELLDLTAITPAAYAALWRFLTEIDLSSSVTGGDRPVHETLPWLLADRRAATQSDRADFQWLRLLDVPAALCARRYAVPGHAVLEVIDPQGFSGGKFHLDVAGDGTAQVSTTTAEPDVVLSVAALGSAYLGQVPLAPMHAAGLIEQRTDGAVARLDALLTWAPTSAIGHTWF